MTLDEAIKRCKEKAEELREQIITALDDGREIYDKDCEECANEHEQLAEWLTELKARREVDRWIPVSERLPDLSGLYLVSVDDLVTVGNFGGTEFTRGNVELRVIAWKPLPEPYKENDNGKES